MYNKLVRVEVMRNLGKGDYRYDGTHRKQSKRKGSLVDALGFLFCIVIVYDLTHGITSNFSTSLFSALAPAPLLQDAECEEQEYSNQTDAEDKRADRENAQEKGIGFGKRIEPVNRLSNLLSHGLDRRSRHVKRIQSRHRTNDETLDNSGNV